MAEGLAKPIVQPAPQAIEILLVEDQGTDAALILRALKQRNLRDRVQWVQDGAAALDALLARPPQTLLRLVLLDVKLPKVDGIEVLRRIKSDELLRAIPVVMLTSSQERRDVQACYAAGANSYIVKPVDFDELMALLDAVLVYWMRHNVLVA